MIEFEYLVSILMIIGIDIVLGGDNAIVIALASRNLPESKQNTAIFFGTLLAIICRILLTIIAVSLLKIPLLNLIGGLLLLWISYKLLVNEKNDHSKIKAGYSLWFAIRTIVFADIVMGFDNVIAIAGAANGNFTLVIIGLLISVPIIIWGSKIILYLMERWPVIIYIGASILAYTAGRMIIHENQLQFLFHHFPLFSFFIPLVAIIIVLLSAGMKNRIKIT